MLLYSFCLQLPAVQLPSALLLLQQPAVSARRSAAVRIQPAFLLQLPVFLWLLPVPVCHQDLLRQFSVLLLPVPLQFRLLFLLPAFLFFLPQAFSALQRLFSVQPVLFLLPVRLHVPLCRPYFCGFRCFYHRLPAYSLRPANH